jgi:PBSX family phage terminase large subunit
MTFSTVLLNKSQYENDALKEYFLHKNIIPIAINEKFRCFFECDKRLQILKGGRGGGKSVAAEDKVFMRMLDGRHKFGCLIIRKALSDVTGSQYAALCNKIKEVDKLFVGIGKNEGYFSRNFSFNSTYKRIIYKINGNFVLGKGMDGGSTSITKGKPQVKSVTGFTSAWYEEAEQGSSADLDTILSSLRGAKGKRMEVIYTFNPTLEAAWIKKNIFDTYGGKHYNNTNTLLHESTYLDNEFIDKEAYELELSKIMSQDRLNVYKLGLWGEGENVARWLYMFDPKRHIGDAVYTKEHSVFISFDFNVSKMCAIAFQCSDIDNHKLSYFHVLREFVVTDENATKLQIELGLKNPSRIDLVCGLILRHYPNSRLFVTGDQTGAKRDAGYKQSQENALSEIKDALSLHQNNMMFGYYNPRYSKVNPSHADSYNKCNRVLKLHPNFIIDKSCEQLIQDVQIGKFKHQTGGNFELYKGDGGGMFAMNLFDCLRYAIHAKCETY